MRSPSYALVFVFGGVYNLLFEDNVRVSAFLFFVALILYLNNTPKRRS